MADRAIHRCAGLNFPARIAAAISVFSNVHGHPAGRNLAGRLPVEYVVGVHAIQGETVAGIALSVSPDRLITETRVTAGSVKKIRIDARAQDRELGKAPRSKREIFDYLSPQERSRWSCQFH